MAFQKATRKKAKLKIALQGPSGSGKTYSALLLAQGIGGKIAVIDTERGSASLYSHLTDFDVDELHKFEPEDYILSIKEAVKAEYEVLVIDSLSHEWATVLEIADKQAPTKNKMSGWSIATPRHQRLIDCILQSPIHVICNMRTKVEWSMEPGPNGKIVPVKLGMAPVQRPGIEYEFTTIFRLASETNFATIDKDRTELFEHFSETLSIDTGKKFKAWLEQGDENLEIEKASQEKKNLIFKMLAECGLKYETPEVRAKLESLTGKPSVTFWTPIDAERVEEYLKDYIKRKFEHLKKKEAEKTKEGEIKNDKIQPAGSQGARATA